MLLVGARLKEEGRGEVARAAELLLQLAQACRLHLGRLWRRRCRRLCCCCCRGRHRYRCRCGRGGGRRRNGRCRRLGCLRLLLLELLLMKLLLAPLLLPKLVALHPQSSERSLKPLNVGICRSVEPVVTILHEAFGLLLDQSTQNLFILVELGLAARHVRRLGCQGPLLGLQGSGQIHELCMDRL